MEPVAICNKPDLPPATASTALLAEPQFAEPENDHEFVEANLGTSV
jgi:hypothetical protein